MIYTMQQTKILLTLTKIEERADAEVPNNIVVGETRDGFIGNDDKLPVVGKPFIIVYENRFGARQTSPVTGILEPWDGIRMKFRTFNSVYELKLRKAGELPV